MPADYTPVIGLALTGFLLLLVRAAADRVLLRFFPEDVLDCAALRTANTIVGAAAWAAGGLAAVLGAVSFTVAGA